MNNELTEHPFQLSHIERFPCCQSINFNNEDNKVFNEYVRELETAFQRTVSEGNYLGFIRQYTDVSTQMLERKHCTETMRALLDNALTRLIVIINFLRLRSRSNLFQNDSVHSFQIEPDLLKEAKSGTDEMERRKLKNQPFDLNRSPKLKQWVTENLQPLIEDYVGFKVVSPSVELRFSDTKMHEEGWRNAYRHHQYGNYHLDQSCYALPFIVYLDDVADHDGPFTYVDGSDKLNQNYILRAFHQTLTFHCGLGGQNDSDFSAMKNLPAVFRGGDLVGTFAGPDPFRNHRVVNFVGPAGTAVMFGGFHLVHSGGHPNAGKRKSLFVNFRYPRFKLRKL